MDFLELSQKTWLKCGLSGDGPSTTAAAQGMFGRIVSYVQEGYRYVQAEHDHWSFHLKSIDTALEIGKQDYLWGDFGISDMGNVSRILMQTLEGVWVPFDLVERSDSAIYDNPSVGTPTQAGYRFGNSLRFNRLPEATTPLRIEYYQSSAELVENTDVPLFSEEYHMAIVFKAMEAYSHYDEDTAIMAEARREYLDAVSKMRNQYLPKLSFHSSIFS